MILYRDVLGIFALPLRSPRRRVPHLHVTWEFLQNAGRDRAEHIKYARSQIPLTQAEGLQILGREWVGDKCNLYVQFMPEPVSNGPSEETVRMCSVLLQAA